MSDELRAAAERLRNSNGCSHWEGADMLTVCNAYLAEHPADDGEPVAVEWIESIGFYRDGTHQDDPFTCRESSIYLSPRYDDEKIWVVFVEVYELGHVKTCGDVRRLLAALGIEVPK